ncbi:MAG: HPr kinase/phosphorylase [Caulobacteraceae bacterium]
MARVLHAGLIARRVRGFWRGALIEGPSGAGKSDLALRALSAGFALVADDRVAVFASEGRLYGRAPGALSGLIEARGVGVIAREMLPLARIVLRVRLVEEAVERMPEPTDASLLGVAVPNASLRPFEASAPAKLGAMIDFLGGRPQERYQAGFAPPGGR